MAVGLLSFQARAIEHGEIAYNKRLRTAEGLSAQGHLETRLFQGPANGPELVRKVPAELENKNPGWNFIGEGFFAFDRRRPAVCYRAGFWRRNRDAQRSRNGRGLCMTIGRLARGRTTILGFTGSFRASARATCGWRGSGGRVPKISADGPHRIQHLGMLSDAAKTAAAVDWSMPCFKLTYRYDQPAAGPDLLLRRLIGPDDAPLRDEQRPETEVPAAGDPPALVSLSVSTENLGDHIQAQAGLELLARFGLSPRIYLDRDFELRSAPGLDARGGHPILLNGWFKRDSPEWPPHPRLEPIFLGFHLRLFQSPSLLSDESLAYYRAHQPIGCRDRHTAQLLSANGVEAYESHCLTLTFPRRVRAASQCEVFVVSRDERLSQALPASLGPFTSILHYTGDTDFARNLARAGKLLEVYGDRARLIVTSLLHCAMPTLALGIPVVMFYPLNSPQGHASDRERFSSLENLLRIWRFDEMDEVNWSPVPPDVGAIKLALIDDLSARLETMGLGRGRKLGPIAEASALAPP